MTRSTSLTDLQLLLLSHAANAEHGHVFPLPAAAAEHERAAKDLKTLLRRGLLAEVETTSPATSWREEGNRRTGLAITEQGASALGLADDGDPEAFASSPPGTSAVAASSRAREARRGSKIANVLALLRRPGGATLPELVEATAWQPHTTRAALTGLKKRVM